MIKQETPCRQRGKFGIVDTKDENIRFLGDLHSNKGTLVGNYLIYV